MTALNTFQFGGGYVLRPATSDDHSLAQAWTLADEHHKLTTRADFWLEQGGGRDSYLLSDPKGPLFFFKVVRVSAVAVELHIQFSPARDPIDRERTREGLRQGMEWLEKVLELNGVKRVRFDSQNSELIAFARKRLGFHVEGNSLFKDI